MKLPGNGAAIPKTLGNGKHTSKQLFKFFKECYLFISSMHFLKTLFSVLLIQMSWVLWFTLLLVLAYNIEFLEYWNSSEWEERKRGNQCFEFIVNMNSMRIKYSCEKREHWWKCYSVQLKWNTIFTFICFNGDFFDSSRFQWVTVKKENTLKTRHHNQMSNKIYWFRWVYYVLHLEQRYHLIRLNPLHIRLHLQLISRRQLNRSKVIKIRFDFNIDSK